MVTPNNNAPTVLCKDNLTYTHCLRDLDVVGSNPRLWLEAMQNCPLGGVINDKYVFLHIDVSISAEEDTIQY